MYNKKYVKTVIEQQKKTVFVKRLKGQKTYNIIMIDRPEKTNTIGKSESNFYTELKQVLQYV